MKTTRITRLALASLPFALMAAAPAPRYAVTGSIAGPDGGWDYASVDPAAGVLYVARGDSAQVVDLKTPANTRSIGTIAHGHAVVPIPDRGLLLVTSGNDDTVRLLDRRDGRQVASIAVGSDPDAAFYDAVRHRAVVMNAKAGTVSVIDVATARVTRTITLKPGLEFGVSVGDTLFVNNEDANEIESANLTTGKVGSAITLTGCEGPSGLAHDARGGRLIAACANGKAAVVDVKRGRLTALLDIGSGPDAVILDAARRVAFISCGKSGELDMLSLTPRGVTVTARIVTEQGARTGALDPRDGTLYLPTARFSPPPVAGKRPTPVPGSFHILVVRRKTA